LNDWLYLQIADFFVHNSLLTGSAVGILRPQGKIMLLDAEDLKYSQYWQHFSDHFPVGAIFSIYNSQLAGHRAVAGAGSEQALALAHVSNMKRFARLQLKADNAPVTLVDTYTNVAIEQLAFRYLKSRQKLLRDKLWKGLEEERMDVEQFEEDPTIDVVTLIRLIQSLEDDMNEPEKNRLFVTSPADFEADEQHM
ncbi:MAG TPA: hypothetical protein VFN35_17640, partial [Ktedonobacteraceae bacterium]|nr:hypothetical protein [Ktedonobacteraceae bacterium]